jgi:hypothetical protein
MAASKVVRADEQDNQEMRITAHALRQLALSQPPQNVLRLVAAATK